MAPRALLSYQKGTLGILLVYIPLLVLPWILTCIVSVRPLTRPSYLNQRGQYSPHDIQDFQMTLIAIRALNSIAALLTVPVTSAVLAHAAVVRTQRRKNGQHFSVRQTFALADRTWQGVNSLISVLWDLIRFGKSSRSSWFLWIGAGILAIGALQQPLQQLLVSTISIQLVTCNDVPELLENNDSSCDPTSPGSFYLGYDPEPADIALIPQNVVGRLIAQQISTFTDAEPQVNLWPEHPDQVNKNRGLGETTFFGIFSSADDGDQNLVKKFFVSSMPNGTTTGVLRQHIMRLNSSISCQNIPASQVPMPCSGTRPFNLTIERDGNMTVSICVPGAFDLSPWNLTRNRQDIREEMYITLQVPQRAGEHLFTEERSVNFTTRCTCNTTRGYYELGNVHNSNTPGPLLERWPAQETLLADFNDFQQTRNGAVPPTENGTADIDLKRLGSVDVTENPDSFNKDLNMVTPGPLMLTTLATFGNNSFVQAAKDGLESGSGDIAFRQICQVGALPFARLEGFGAMHNRYVSICDRSSNEQQLSPQDGNANLLELVHGFVANFNDPPFAQMMLTAGTFLANRALLTQTVAATQSDSARPLITSTGMTLSIPSLSRASLLAISVLIGVQVLLLTGLAIYTYSIPTWTTSFNAMCIAKLAAEKEPGSFGSDFEDYDHNVAQMDGLVGLECDGKTRCISSEVSIALGGQGLVTRDLATKISIYDVWRLKDGAVEPHRLHEPL